MADAILRLENVSHQFMARGRRVQAVASIDLAIGEGEFVTIVGPSGCGKSTLLNVIVGLVPPTHGRVLYRGRPIAGINTAIGYVTQHDYLFPWRTLRDSVEFLSIACCSRSACWEPGRLSSAAGFMAASRGLGFLIQVESSVYNTTGALAGILLLMVMVIVLNAVLNRAEARILRWRPIAAQRAPASELQ